MGYASEEEDDTAQNSSYPITPATRSQKGQGAGTGEVNLDHSTAVIRPMRSGRCPIELSCIRVVRIWCLPSSAFAACNLWPARLPSRKTTKMEGGLPGHQTLVLGCHTCKHTRRLHPASEKRVPLMQDMDVGRSAFLRIRSTDKTCKLRSQSLVFIKI